MRALSTKSPGSFRSLKRRPVESRAVRCGPAGARLGRRLRVKTSRAPGAVLVASDQEMMRSTMARVLRRFGYRVFEASGPMDAQRLASSRRGINLLVSDFGLDEAGAVELARWFQERFPGRKAIIATGSLWELLYRTGDHEPFGVLVKPFSDVELGRMVRGLLG